RFGGGREAAPNLQAHALCVSVSPWRIFVTNTSTLPRLTQDAERRIPTRRSHDSAARVRRRSAHPQILNRCLVLRPSRHRAREEQLLERQLSLKDVALGQAELAF